MVKTLFLNALLFLFLNACQKHYLTVTKVSIDRSSLASSFTKTPDPRQSFPPKGEQLVIEWNLPSTVNQKTLRLELSLVYKNYKEETFTYILESTRGVLSYFLMGQDFLEKKGVMTYKAELKTQEGEVIKMQRHKLWVSLIHIDEEEE
jgi:hypothetical protein